MQHPAFPRGPPPQYYLDSTELNFAVRMGSGLGAGSDPRTQGTRRRRARPTSTLGATAPPQHESAVRPIPLARGRQVAHAVTLGDVAASGDIVSLAIYILI